MSRYIVRSLPLLVLLILFSAAARADSFQVTFVGDLSGTAQFTTNGVCTSCSVMAGLLTFTADIGADTGPNAFDITDDESSQFIVYDRSTNSLTSPGSSNSETQDFFVPMSDGHWILEDDSTFAGTYTISPAGVPEPPASELWLLSAIVLAAGLSIRKRYS